MAGNGSAFTSGNPNAPEGTQVAFLQQTGSMSQSVAGWAAGTYTISFQAAQRGNYGGDNNFEVLVDGAVVGSFTPSSTSYATYTTASFAVSAGSHTVEFLGINSTGGDDTAFIDQIAAVAVAVAPAVGDSGFESPSEGTGSAAYAYNPTGTAWTFSGPTSSGGSGVAGNGSAFTSGNPNAPEGTQVAFLQQAGSMSQSIAGWAAGSYTISFQAAQRGGGSSNDFEVEVDGTVVGTFTPSGTSYASYTTPTFTVSAGSHAVEFLGLGSAGGDNTAFIDAVSVALAATPAGPAVGDPGFEAPALAPGTYQFNPSGTPWTFSGSPGDGSGVVTNDDPALSGGNPDAPQGTQVGFLQRNGSITQTITGWAAGTYILSFDAAQRAYGAGPVGISVQDFEVLVDGHVVGTFRPASTAYAAYATAPFTVSAGSHAVEFLGLDSAGGDNTAFLDAVGVAAVSTRATLYDGQTPLLDFDGSGAVAARYLSVPGAIDELLARQTAAGVAWYLTDREGSVNDIIDNSGSVIDHVDYGVYGTVQDESNPAAGDRYKYAGMELDAATGLYYDRARYYDAAMGRFINPDPTGLSAGDNDLFRFASNNPVDYIDVTGKYGTPIGRLPGMLGGIAGTLGGRLEGGRIGTAIANTYMYAPTYYYPRFRDQRHFGYYCYEWAYAFLDAANLESSGKYFDIVLEVVKVPKDPEEKVHAWVKITSKETGKSIYVDDSFGNGSFVNTTPPIPPGYTEKGNPKLDARREDCSPPPARGASSRKKSIQEILKGLEENPNNEQY